MPQDSSSVVREVPSREDLVKRNQRMDEGQTVKETVIVYHMLSLCTFVYNTIDQCNVHLKTLDKQDKPRYIDAINTWYQSNSPLCITPADHSYRNHCQRLVMQATQSRTLVPLKTYFPFLPKGLSQKVVELVHLYLLLGLSLCRSGCTEVLLRYSDLISPHHHHHHSPPS